MDKKNDLSEAIMAAGLCKRHADHLALIIGDFSSCAVRSDVEGLRTLITSLEIIKQLGIKRLLQIKSSVRN
jgi:hypothetical protein